MGFHKIALKLRPDSLGGNLITRKLYVHMFCHQKK